MSSEVKRLTWRPTLFKLETEANERGFKFSVLQCTASDLTVDGEVRVCK